MFKMFSQLLLKLIFLIVCIGLVFSKPSTFDLIAEETQQFEQGEYLL